MLKTLLRSDMSSNMQMAFRWYGDRDTISLEHIGQIPCVRGIVTAMYDSAVGEQWSEQSFATLMQSIADKGLECKTIESIPVHEDIKLGKASGAAYIENYKDNIRLVAKYGVQCICYNFMPVFDWIRSDLQLIKKDGSKVLVYEQSEVDLIDPRESELTLPGWDTSYTREGLSDLLAEYEGITEAKLMDNLSAFLREIIPVAEECGVQMAIHPDDPPWSCYGLPRIAKTLSDMIRITESYSSSSNCITLCTGSLGARADNDITSMIKILGDKIAFVHLRNVQIKGEHCFEETGHISNERIDMYEVIRGLQSVGYNGDIRPDHGRAIWNEPPKGGYGLYDRALGAMYISGIIEAIVKRDREDKL